MSTATNQAQFSNTIAGWAKSLKVKAATLQKKITFDLQRELTKETPVKTGVLHANWHSSVGAPSDKVDYNATSPSAPDDIVVDGSQNTYVTNNIFYGPFVNDGTEHIAPRGFREIAMARVQGNIEKAVREIERGE